MIPEIPPFLSVLLTAIRAKDWTTLQQLSRSPDPTIRAAAHEAADCISEVEMPTSFQSMLDDPDPKIQDALQAMWESIPRPRGRAALRPVFLEALIHPAAHGFPTDPRLKIPAVAWISRDPSPEAQTLAWEIWETMPPQLQQECREILGLNPCPATA